jgi:phosphate transport system protein
LYRRPRYNLRIVVIAADAGEEMPNHTVTAYDAELGHLRQKIAEMGGIAEKMLADAIRALVELDGGAAQVVVATDPRVDALERAIEEDAVLLIARRQPMALDLREIMASMRIAGELERIGDLAKNIARRTITLASEQRMTRATVGIRHMGDIAALHLHDVLDAYIQLDVEKARSVWTTDTELDALEDSVFRDLLTFMMEDPRSITFCTHLLFCAKNIERIGDHATNIAEMIHYLVTGEALPVTRPKGGSAS